MYLPEDVLSEFRKATESRQLSMSALAGDVLTEYLYGKKSSSMPTAAGIAEEVVRLLRQKDIIGYKFAPMMQEPTKPVQYDDSAAQSYQNPTLEDTVDKSSANLAPQSKPRATETNGRCGDRGTNKGGPRFAPNTTRRRAVDGRQDGGGSSDT